MRFVSTDDINSRIAGGVDAFTARCENYYQRQINIISTALSKHTESSPIVLLSGPSGSGKTTTALRIENVLDNCGIECHTLSMDNYFLPHDMTPKAVDENGKTDYESPYRLDIKLLNEHLEKIANCEPVDVPMFDFVHQKRISGHTLSRKKGELVIMEGIHALNPEVTGKSDLFTTGIYVSVRTRLQNKNGDILHPSKIRLARRLIRDLSFRARKFEDTMDMFDSVERGENLYIMPHKHHATYDIDTFIDYELSVYRAVMLEEFHKLSETYADYSRFSDIERFFQELEPITPEAIPQNSLVREFIGGSSLKY